MLWHVFEWGHQCYGMFSNGGTNVMACFRMGGPMLWHVFERPSLGGPMLWHRVWALGFRALGGTNVMACFRMAGGRTNVMACFRMAWALGFRGLGFGL